VHATWALADLDSVTVKIIVFLAVIVIYAIKLGKGFFKERAEEERRQAAGPPKRAPETASAAGEPAKQTAATEVDRFLEELARQSGAPVPPRPTAPPRPRPPVTVAPPPKAPAPAPRASAPAAKMHSPLAVHHMPTSRPESARAAMADVIVTVEPEPVTGLPAMDHLSPLAQAIALREILGPCRAFRPHRPRPRAW
jgi:hypothetical protein